MSGNLGENLSNSLMSQGNLAYSSAINKNQQALQMVGMLTGTGGGGMGGGGGYGGGGMGGGGYY